MSYGREKLVGLNCKQKELSKANRLRFSGLEDKQKRGFGCKQMKLSNRGFYANKGAHRKYLKFSRKTVKRKTSLSNWLTGTAMEKPAFSFVCLCVFDLCRLRVLATPPRCWDCNIHLFGGDGEHNKRSWWRSNPHQKVTPVLLLNVLRVGRFYAIQPLL